MNFTYTEDEALGISCDDITTLREIMLYRMECSREVRMRFYRINQAIRDAVNGINHFNLDAEHLELVKDMFHLVLEEVRKFTRKINYLIKLICLRSNAEDFRVILLYLSEMIDSYDQWNENLIIVMWTIGGENLWNTFPKPIFVVPEQLEYIEYDSIDSLLDDDASERFEEDD
ncbi:uncharacterized protein LOC129796204 [Lutzomyia longipalpis]|uniref:uncharacterized protein LOC129796204 n=1 Tax=Lutzomyia longipalpis TaxID=7200 RepID=UPI0024843DB0|nr:uncharacterized protein LOC129796204 [Lutzomyia longipalpis]